MNFHDHCGGELIRRLMAGIRLAFADGQIQGRDLDVRVGLDAQEMLLDGDVIYRDNGRDHGWCADWVWQMLGQVQADALAGEAGMPLPVRPIAQHPPVEPQRGAILRDAHGVMYGAGDNGEPKVIVNGEKVKLLWQHDGVITGSTDQWGQPLYGFTATSSQPMYKQCKAGQHILAHDQDFCQYCCWKCQTIPAVPYCGGCRTALRKEQKNELAQWVAKNFPRLQPVVG